MAVIYNKRVYGVMVKTVPSKNRPKNPNEASNLVSALTIQGITGGMVRPAFELLLDSISSVARATLLISVAEGKLQIVQLSPFEHLPSIHILIECYLPYLVPSKRLRFFESTPKEIQLQTSEVYSFLG